MQHHYIAGRYCAFLPPNTTMPDPAKPSQCMSLPLLLCSTLCNTITMHVIALLCFALPMPLFAFPHKAPHSRHITSPVITPPMLIATPLHIAPALPSFTQTKHRSTFRCHSQTGRHKTNAKLYLARHYSTRALQHKALPAHCNTKLCHSQPIHDLTAA